MIRFSGPSNPTKSSILAVNPEEKIIFYYDGKNWFGEYSGKKVMKLVLMLEKNSFSCTEGFMLANSVGVTTRSVAAKKIQNDIK